MSVPAEGEKKRKLLSETRIREIVREELFAIEQERIKQIEHLMGNGQEQLQRMQQNFVKNMEKLAVEQKRRERQPLNMRKQTEPRTYIAQMGGETYRINPETDSIDDVIAKRRQERERERKD